MENAPIYPSPDLLPRHQDQPGFSWTRLNSESSGLLQGKVRHKGEHHCWAFPTILVSFKRSLHLHVPFTWLINLLRQVLFNVLYVIHASKQWIWKILFTISVRNRDKLRRELHKWSQGVWNRSEVCQLGKWMFTD